MSDGCPFCGEPYMESVRKYGCDFLASTPVRSLGCYARQITNLQARLKDAEDRLEAWRYLINYPTDSKEHKDAENKLKSIGEI